MTEHKHIYQAMFLLDNEEVRKGFNAARDWVKTTLEKYGLEVKALRLWGERPLAYSVGGRKRATYLMGWLEGSGDAVNEAKRELYLLGPVFRCLFLHEEEIPAEELVLGVQEMKDSELVIPEEVVEPEYEDIVEAPAAEAPASEQTKEDAGSSDERDADKKLKEVKTDGH